MTVVKRDYKSNLFCELFGAEEHKRNALELYNALSGKTLVNLEELEITTIGNTVFLGRSNDVSYLVGDEMLLWEHQTTDNPNMPLRGLMYFSRLYEKYITTNNLDIYGSKRLYLPTARFVVFYFGRSEKPDREVLTLSQSFASGPGDVEVRATVLNCNEGHNTGIMQACAALRGYAHLVALARAYRAGTPMSIGEAVRQAIDQCIMDGYLTDYLIGHRAEAEDMLFTMEDEERAMRVHREAIEREAREQGWTEGHKEGREQGLKDGRLEGARKGMREGRLEGMREGRLEGRRETQLAAIRSIMQTASLDVSSAMDMLQIPADERLELAALL